MTLDALLRLLAERIGEAAGPDALAPLLERAASIPLDLTRLVGLETRLGAGDGGADLLVMLVPPASLRRLRDADSALADRLGGGPELESLLDALTDSGAPLHDRLGDAWLEYDLADGNGRSPSLFAGPSTPGDAGDVLLVLGGSRVPPSVEQGLRRLAAGLGEGEIVQQVGVMLGRPAAPVRCVLRSPTGGRRPGAAELVRAGWSGDRDLLARALERYGQLVRHHSLAVGFEPDGSLSGAVGVELQLPSLHDARAVMAALVADGVATAASAERALAWHGHDLDPDFAACPSDIRAAVELTGHRSTAAVVRRVHHVKLGLVPGRPLTAKAYLGASLRLAH